MKKHRGKRLCTLLLVLAMVFGMVTPAAAAAKPTGTAVPWEQVDSSEVTA